MLTAKSFDNVVGKRDETSHLFLLDCLPCCSFSVHLVAAKEASFLKSYRPTSASKANQAIQPYQPLLPQIGCEAHCNSSTFGRPRTFRGLSLPSSFTFVSPTICHPQASPPPPRFPYRFSSSAFLFGLSSSTGTRRFGTSHFIG
jgi:hypothetical protein